MKEKKYWHVLGRREFRHQLAILRPVSAHAGCPLPGGIGTAHYGYQAATASRGIGHDGIRSTYTLSREGDSTMNVSLKVILAVYNCLVGDLAILIGILPPL